MDKEDVIKLFCELATKVSKEVYNNSYAHDCFCIESLRTSVTELGGYRFEEPVFDFIKRAVNRAIADHKGAS